MKFAYYSHHKCATRWTNSILREFCFHLGLVHKTLHGVKNWSEFEGLNRFVEKHGVEFLAFTNARQEEVEKLPEHHGFHVIRDPRNKLISAYYSHLDTHSTDTWPELAHHRKKLQSLNKEKGLLEEIRFSKENFKEMINWDYDQGHILEIKMEDLTENPQNTFKKVFDHLQIPIKKTTVMRRTIQKCNRVLYYLNHKTDKFIPIKYFKKEFSVDKDVFDSIIDYHKFDKVKRREEEKREKTHYKKGKSRNWRAHFTEKVEKAFEKEFGDIATKLGYETK